MKNKVSLLLLVLLGASLVACFVKQTRAEDPIVGDLNGDGEVNLIDLVTLAALYGTTSADAEWNPIADLNTNNIVDLQDLVILGQNWTGY